MKRKRFIEKFCSKLVSFIIGAGETMRLINLFKVARGCPSPSVPGASALTSASAFALRLLRRDTWGRPGLLCLLITLLFPLPLLAQQPNIILVMMDDMGWGDPYYNSMTVTLADGVTPHPDRGWISTPTLDTMAANGLRFDRFYAASAVCSPTRASVLTGRNPMRVGIPNANAGKLGFDETPLSEVLSGAGYRTGFFGKWHLGVLTTVRYDSNRGAPGATGVYSAPWHHGYDACFATEAKVPTYHPYRDAINGRPLPVDFADGNFYGTYYWRFPEDPVNDPEGDMVPVNEVNNLTEGDDSKLIVDQAIPFIQNAVSNNTPLFVVLWFHTPHKPIVDPEGVSGVDSSDACKDAIEDVDFAIGRVRDELDALGVRSNTMFWVTSDNGPENGVDSPSESDTVRSIRSGGFRQRKRSLHEGGVRVPGILEWPNKIPTGRTTDYPAVTSDYYPTILDFLDIGVPNQKPLDGISLRPVIEGTATNRTSPIGFLYTDELSWVNQQYKLIDKGSGWQLYDLINDPAETNMLANSADIDEQPQDIQNIYSNMLAEYTAWKASVDTDKSYIPPAAPTVMLTTPSTNVTGSFTVTATFSEDVDHLNAGEFTVVNGIASNLIGSYYTYIVALRRHLIR